MPEGRITDLNDGWHLFSMKCLFIGWNVCFKFQISSCKFVIPKESRTKWATLLRFLRNDKVILKSGFRNAKPSRNFVIPNESHTKWSTLLRFLRNDKITLKSGFRNTKPSYNFVIPKESHAKWATLLRFLQTRACKCERTMQWQNYTEKLFKWLKTAN